MQSLLIHLLKGTITAFSILLCLTLWRTTSFANSQIFHSIQMINLAQKNDVFFVTRNVPNSNGYEVFHNFVQTFLEEQAAVSATVPQAIFIAEVETPHNSSSFDIKNKMSHQRVRKPASQEPTTVLVKITAKSTSMMSIGAAIFKSAVGTSYYFHYLPIEPALIGSIFSTIHSLIFTSQPMAEQELILNPIKKALRIDPALNMTKAKTIDLVASTIHKLFNLAIVSTIINWANLDPSEIIKDAAGAALAYSLIKNFWKIHLDYLARAERIVPKTYFIWTSSLELAAWGLMPAIMLDQSWAIILGAGMAATGFLANANDKSKFKPRQATGCEVLLGL